MYFGGISPAAQELCAKHCDVFLMWPETEDRIAETMRSMSEQAAAFNRKIDFGFRAHMIVRETEKEAREAANRLISKLDMAKGQEIKNRSMDSQSAGVLRQDEIRAQSKDLFIEEHLWSGVGWPAADAGVPSSRPGSGPRQTQSLHRYGNARVHPQWLSASRGMRFFAKHVLPGSPRVV